MSDKKVPGLKELIGETLQSAQQEMMLTLPNRLVLAFSRKVHRRDIDPETREPFASFYRWLWTMPPAGVGLQNYPHIDVSIILGMLEKTRDKMPLQSRGIINALIGDLVAGRGASRGKGGRPKKQQEENRNGAVAVPSGDSVRKRSASAAALAARMEGSKDPKIQAAWQDHVAGRYRTVTAAAVACGMIKDGHAPLPRLKQYWNKASAAERRAFLEFIREEG
jgi:hypothetical protein